MFLQSVIPIFDSFYTFSQSEQHMIHILYHSSLLLYRSLLSRFILPKVISKSDDMLSIDLEDPDVLKDFSSIFIGAMTKQYARDIDIIGTSEYKKSHLITSGTKYLNKLIYTLVNLVLNTLQNLLNFFF